MPVPIAQSSVAKQRKKMYKAVKRPANLDVTVFLRFSANQTFFKSFSSEHAASSATMVTSRCSCKIEARRLHGDLRARPRSACALASPLTSIRILRAFIIVWDCPWILPDAAHLLSFRRNVYLPQWCSRSVNAVRSLFKIRSRLIEADVTVIPMPSTCKSTPPVCSIVHRKRGIRFSVSSAHPGRSALSDVRNR